MLLSIDEAIAHAREVANSNKTKATYDDEFLKRFCTSKEACIKCAEENGQLAEWLEELKKRRSEDYGYMADIHQSIGYRKAIDDFADKIISLCDDGEFMNRLNEFTATTTLEIAEQLKEGVKYEM